MQEEVEQRTLALVMNGTKLTGRMLKAALTKYLAYVKEHKRESQATADVIPHGKQTVQELIGQNQGVSNIEINDPSIRAFERIARKYGVDYAIKKDRSSTPPKYLVFFKGRDADGPDGGLHRVYQQEGQAGRAAADLAALQDPGAGPASTEKPQPGGGAMNNVSLKKRLIPWLPYGLIGLFATNLGEAWRLASGTDASQKLLGLMASIPLAFAAPLPSFHPFDLLVGLCSAGLLRMAVYLKSKNAKKYRKGVEYGSARWGTPADIAPYVDPVFQQNVILTQTERLTMSSRPKEPKYARNKNVLVIGGSGSGKTRFFVKPSAPVRGGINPTLSK